MALQPSPSEAFLSNLNDTGRLAVVVDLLLAMAGGSASGGIPAGASQSPISGATTITASDTVLVAAGRQFLVSCTVAGNLKVKFSDGSTLTFAIPVGLSVLSWAVTQVFVTGTTATVTCTNLL